MIDAGKRLRHSIVVGIFGLQSELLHLLGRGASTKAAVSLKMPEGRISVRDQAKANVVVGESGPGCAEDSFHKVVVEERRSQRKLGLFQREETVVVPRSLPEQGEGQRVSLKVIGVCLLRLIDLREKVGT